MAFTVYHHPTKVKIGDQLLAGVDSIVVNVRDGRISGCLTFASPESASLAAGKSGILSFSFSDTGHMQILHGITIGGYDVGAASNGQNITLPFVGGNER